ncbi:hypothetical protein ACRRS0_05635 [Agarivorans sp. QJM3NY_29]|uniref:hypothetical protein n=1 Tax=unclassified Agarivorans TaxID=2636026 RepID=UPI003D7DA8F7
MLGQLSACSTANHGSFAERSFYQGELRQLVLLGPTYGEHCQTYALYLFPIKQSPSTQLALQQAKQAQPHTQMLANISIHHKTYWGIAYAKHCVTVTAEAYAAP